MRKRNTLILVATIFGLLVAGIVPASLALHSAGTTKAAAAPGGHSNAGSMTKHTVNGAALINEAKVPQATKAQIAGAHSKSLPVQGDQAKFAAEKAKAAKVKGATVTPQRLAPASAAGPGVYTPGAQQSFNGMSDLCGCAPPDMAIAVNESYVVQAVNTTVAIYHANNGTIVSGWPKTFTSFFGVPNPTGCSSPQSPFLSDPRAFYEPNKRHFWVAALEVEGAFGANDCNLISRYWVAVSVTNNPTGLWNVYAFDMTLGSNSVAADYTQIGVDASGFYWSGNMYDLPGANFEYSNYFGAPRRFMEAGAGFTYYTFSNPTWCNSVCISFDTLQPVMTETISTGPRGEVFASTWNDCSGCNSSTTRGDPEGHDCNSTSCNGGVVLVMSNIDNANGDGPTVTLARFSGGYLELLPPGGTTPSCSNCLETLDSRISATPVYSAGNIYYAFETRFFNGSQNVAGIAVEQVQVGMTDSDAACHGGDHCADVDAGSTGIIQSAAQVYGGNASASFGALMVNNNGDIIMVFEFSSGGTNPEVAYVARRATFHGSGFHDGGFILHGGAGSSSGRWGDYEATSYTGFYLDQIWIAGEWAQSNGDWSTTIGRVNFTSLYQS